MSAHRKKRSLKKGSAGLSIVAVFTLVLSLLGLGLSAGAAQATSGGKSSVATASSNKLDPAKAAVCKYVGKPGIDERLQTGNNPIVVDRKDWMVKGSYFMDAQGRSYVIDFLNPGDPEPDVSQCPAPDVPPPPTKTEVTAVDGTFIDLCGTEYNLQFRSAVTEGVAYLETRTGNTDSVRAVVTDDSKYVLTNPDWSQSATDTLTPCDVPPPPAKTQVTAVDGTFADSCGTEYNLSFTPAVTEGVRYVETREGNTLTAHAEVTDSAKYELTNPDWTQSKTDELVPCTPPPPVVNTLHPFDFTVTCGMLTGDYPKSNPAGILMYGSRSLPEPDNKPEVVKPGQKITIKTSRSVLDIMIFVDGYQPLVWTGVKVPQNCTTPPPHHTPQPPVHNPPVHNPPVVHPHPVVNNPAPWTPPTKQRFSGGNTGIDTAAVVSQTSAPSLVGPFGAAGLALVGVLGFGLVLWRRRQLRALPVRD